ncbi:biorientation of chromosomes in cell division protein 1-like 1 isoform X2 [Mytilus californianus]|uniref:biorientation of chromosomes in cell division protein 1-like 1 isoform X2 n=1 Tax=Mytilus californianus TaxID=6549 RepID=UPI0022486071|nr:biorientation of chromosomes in cell division protein 1-like 1 isoform X2 [Mytilus californianus]
MSSSTSTDAEEERRVKDIIDALKSEGLFDQFRKECLADVDTKPAYQNLRQRVEGYVSRFLSRQQWSPSLNKNQLRDNLRKQITASGMLANGVERVIEQVINPKILQLIKPKIDEVVCSHLGIDSKERKAQQEAQKQQQKENLQSLMSINLSQAEQNQTSTPSSFQGEQSSAAAPTFSSPYSQAIWTQQMPPQVAFGGMMPNYPMVPPFGGFPPFGMPPQMFPYWNNFMFPQPIPGMPGIPFPPPMSSTATTTTVTSSQFAVSPIPPVPSTPTSTTQTTAVDTPTPPKSSQPPLPPTPPPPGTEDIPVVIPKEESKDKVTKALFSGGKQEEKGETYDIPLPPIARAAGKVKSKMGIVIENEDSNQSYEMDIEDDDEESQDTKRPYKFAWDEVVDADQKSDITISSVHTSDLSSFEFDELGSGSDNDMFDSDKSASEDDEYIERPQASPLSVVGDKTPEISEDDFEDLESTEILPNTSTDIEVPDVELKPSTSTDKEVPPTTTTDAEVYPVTSTVIEQESPELSIPLPPTADVATGVEEVVSPSKQKKLISLQYNYSDSEDEETREARKSRIAKEKEERYLKRAQRRAELEAKRREREEEKARIREERKKSKEQKADESTDKGQTDSSERIERTDSLEESSPEKVPSSPEKKKRKTKAELKMELTKQKVMEKKAALRRQRTRNRRYTSDEFTSIFNEKKQPFSSQSYSEVVIEEPTIEETIVTDHIEYIVDESQNHPEYHTQEVCETMEGEVILEDGRQLKVEVFMEDMPSTPPTPTQDEPFTEVVTIDEDSSSAHIEDNSASSTQGKSIDSSESALRATSPLSDVSDESFTEVPKGTKRKRQTSEKYADQNSSRYQYQSQWTEREPKKSQRYDTSDLYKPRPNIRGSRRRNSSPGAAFEKDESQQPSRRKRQTSRKSDTSRSSRHSSRSRSRSVESDCQPSPISSSSLTSVHSRGSSYSRSGSSSSSSSEKSKSRSRSRSSGSSVDEFGRRKRRKGKMPIEMIDFGEAERMIEKNLYRVSFGEAEKRAASSMDVPSIAKPTKMTKYDRRFKVRGRGGTMTRGGTWQRQNSWQFPEGANSGSWSPQGSPTKRYYFPEPGRSPSPQSPLREVSPGMWDARSESPPYYPGTRGRRSSSQLLEDSPPRRSQFAIGRRPQSPPPEYLRRSLSPSEHMMAPEPWGREPSMSPPRVRGHRSPSPPYIGGRLTPSPPPYIPRGQRSPSPGRPYLRGRSPSPYRTGMRRTPSPPLSRGGHSPSPPFYRGSPPHRPVTRGRSPSPPYHRRSPSPHRPMTRGQTAISPHDLRKKPAVNSPKVPMTNKLRNIKFGSPFQQMGTRRGRSSPPSEKPPSKRGRR